MFANVCLSYFTFLNIKCQYFFEKMFGILKNIIKEKKKRRSTPLKWVWRLNVIWDF